MSEAQRETTRAPQNEPAPVKPTHPTRHGKIATPSMGSLTARTLAGLMFAAGAAIAQTPAPWAQAPQQPEGASVRHAPSVLQARQWMVVTAHPLASGAAETMIVQGGSAVDAAIAAQMMLTLVEPQSSGIGGGAFLVHHDPASGRTDAFDGRETAPAALDDSAFLRADGSPRAFHEAAVGGLAVGTPGVLAMLREAHQAYGRLPWADLFRPAIETARDGFLVTERLHTLIAADRFLALDPQARRYFFREDGKPREIGERLRNPDLAQTLEAIAAQGPAALAEGPIAEDIVNRVRSHPLNPGRLSLADLSGYRAIRREALCTPWRTFELCGMPPPSAGAVAVAQTLLLFGLDPEARLIRRDIQGADAGKRPLTSTNPATRSRDPDPAGTHRFLEAARLAFADRDRFLADPDFVQIPMAGLLDPIYLRARAGLIGERAMGFALPGDPWTRRAHSPVSPSVELERSATSHLSIVDPAGRVVSMTSSIEDAFGARLMVRGFLLNNQLTDFSFMARRDGVPVANRVEPGKRPRSSMSPTLVFEREPSRSERGPWRLAIGSPGGASIIGYVARTLQLTLAEDVPLQEAIASPHFGNRNGPTDIEALREVDDQGLAAALAARGHTLRRQPMTSGLHGIIRVCPEPRGADRSGCFLESGIDPRREGSARGG